MEEIIKIEVEGTQYNIADLINRAALGGNVQSIEWSYVNNINNYLDGGLYHIKGERTGDTDNLPIMNVGSGHTIDGMLYVLDSSINESEVCVTQVLMLSNRVGGDGHVFIRTGNATSKDDLLNGNGWSTWSKQQGIFEMNQINDATEIDSYTTNGMYSGVVANEGSVGNLKIMQGSTILLITINGYAAVPNDSIPAQGTQMLYVLPLGYDATQGTASLQKAHLYLRTGIWVTSAFSWADWTQIDGVSGGGSAEDVFNGEVIESLSDTDVFAVKSGEKVHTVSVGKMKNVFGSQGGGTSGGSVEIVNDLTTGGANKALSAEMGKELGKITDITQRMLNMGLNVEEIFSSISDSFVLRKYPMFKNGGVVNAGETNLIGYYILSGELLSESYSIKAFLQCNGDSPAAIAFYSSENDFKNTSYLGGVQHKNTKGEWFEAKIPSDAKACLIINRKMKTSDADPVVLVLKKEKIVEEIFDLNESIKGPDSYQEEKLGELVISSTTTTASIDINCKYGDVLKIVADANTSSFFVGTANYKDDLIANVLGNQTLYLILDKGVRKLYVYTPINNSLQRTISVYKCSKKESYNYPNLVGSFFRYYIPTISNGNWLVGKSCDNFGKITTDKERATTGILNMMSPYLRISLSDTDNFRFYVFSFLFGKSSDSKWQTSYEKKFHCDSLAITLEKTNGDAITEKDLEVITIEFLEPIIESYVGEGKIMELNSRVSAIEKNTLSSIGTVNNVLNVTKPYYYHFAPDSFIKDGDGNNVIPSQTSYDIELASRLGFTSIEANIHATSDGNFICMHGSGGNFGSTVLSLDGSDISKTSIGTKTLQWIKDNVRFKSYYEKYKLAPLSLEEFCSCCRSNGIGIFAGTGNTDAINTCVRMLGTDNVMLYGAVADKRSIFKGMMFVWVNSTSTTIDDILNTARNYGLPFMYGLGPSLLSALVANNQLSELCSKMHAEGFTLASTSVYDTDENIHNAFKLGVDFSASGHQVNNFEPNYFVCSLDDESIEGTATITDGTANLSVGQTIICGKEDKIIGKAILNIRYTGKLTINFGSEGNRTIISDGNDDIVLSDYFFKRKTILTITADSDTTVVNLVYKVSVC